MESQKVGECASNSEYVLMQNNGNSTHYRESTPQVEDSIWQADEVTSRSRKVLQCICTFLSLLSLHDTRNARLLLESFGRD